jgi:hypothetical protein
MILADELPVIFHYRNPGVVFLSPVFSAVHILDNEIQLAAYQGLQFFDHYSAKMAVLAAVDDN